MRRVQVGLEAWANPQEFSAMPQELGKDVLARIKPHMVKLTGYDAHGTAVQHASGFLYTKDAELIMTCNHVRYYINPQQQQQPVACFKAKYASDDMEEEVHVFTNPHPLYDLMLLGGTRRAATNFLADILAAGDTVYVAGFPPESAELCYSKGMIGAITPMSMPVNAHADKGWSGGPIVNMRGRLVGMIYQGVGTTIKRPESISATRLHDFAVGNNFPGLSA